MDKEKAASKEELNDESGYSEKQTDLDTEIRAGEWQSLRRFRTYRARSRQGKIIATHQAVANRVKQLEKLFYSLCRDNPAKARKLLLEIKELRLIQEALLQCLVWEPGQIEQDMLPADLWELIK